jgi:hypothetical protein
LQSVEKKVVIEALQHLQQNEERTLSNGEPVDSVGIPVETQDSCDAPDGLFLQEIALDEAENDQDGIIFVVLLVFLPIRVFGSNFFFADPGPIFSLFLHPDLASA